MKAVKFILLVCFCTLSAGIATGNVTFQIIGTIACVVFICVYFIMFINDRKRKKNIAQMAEKVNTQMAARQGVTPEMLQSEYNDLFN